MIGKDPFSMPSTNKKQIWKKLKSKIKNNLLAFLKFLKYVMNFKIVIKVWYENI